MIRRVLCLLVCGGWAALAREVPLRTWTSTSGFTVEASLIGVQNETVALRRADGQTVEVPLRVLIPADQALAQQSAPPPVVTERPSGRRELSWEPLEAGADWPAGIDVREREALESLRSTWSRAETRYFRIHFQQQIYARQVARQADYFYEFIAADLPGTRDRIQGKSDIVILRGAQDWQLFITRSGAKLEWAAAYVRGNVMFLYNMGAGDQNAHILAHEMSHLVLNRFFVRPPPLWLNEGLAEWYGFIGWKSFKGQLVNPRRELGSIAQPYPLEELFAMNNYPENRGDIRRFYQTSHHVVGFLMLKEGMPAFVRFLDRITVQLQSVEEALREVYGYSSPAQLEAEFRQFVR